MSTATDKALKAAIAQRIQDALKRESFARLPIETIEQLNVYAISPLLTRVRVKTNEGVYYYEVKVSEPI